MILSVKGKESALGIEAASTGSTTTVKAEDVAAEADCGAIGIKAAADSGYDEVYTYGDNQKPNEEKLSSSGDTSVFVNNVTAKGEGSTAIYVRGDDITRDGNASSKINIVAEGTVSGEDVAIKVLEESTGEERVDGF